MKKVFEGSCFCQSSSIINSIIYSLSEPPYMSEITESDIQAAKVQTNNGGLETIYFDMEHMATFYKRIKELGMHRGDEQFIKMHLFDSWESKIAYIDDSKHYLQYESKMMRYCIHKVLEEQFEIDEIVWIDEAGRIGNPRWENAQIFRGENGKVSIPKQVFFSVYDKNKSPWIIKVFTWDDDESQVNIYTAEPQEKVNELWQSFQDYFAEKGPMRGELFTPMGEYIESNGNTFDDVVLSDEVKDKVMMNTVEFFKNIKKYGEHGLSTSRGVILAGKPGTGKTLTLESIISAFPQYTRIYATSESLMGRHHIRHMYKIARMLKPSIVFIEDIDTLGASDDDDYYRTPLLGEILTALNSIESNDEILTIATTNYPDALDIAIRDRPGRFDVRIDFEMPDRDARRIILKKYLSNFNIDESLIKYDKIIKETDGFSGAWLVELVQTSFSFALRDDSNDPTITIANLESAMKVVKENRVLAKKQRDSMEESSHMYGA